MKKKNLLTRAIIIAVVTIAGLYLVIGPRHRPTLKDFTWSGIKASLAHNIHLGLDLQGGSHLVMRVKTENYLKDLTEGNTSAAQNAAKDAGFEVKGGRADVGGGNYRIVIELADPSKATEARDAVEKKVEIGDTSAWTFNASGNQISWTMTPTAERVLADNATTQALNIIDSRINALGITEPTLQTHGAQSSHQILLQMPGVQDPEREGNPEGRIATRAGARNRSGESSASTTYPTELEAINSLNSAGTIPPNRRVLPYQERIDSRTDKTKDPNQQRPTQYVGG